MCLSILVPSSGEDKNPFEDQYNTAKCTGGDSFLYHGRCYTFYDTSKTWTGARDFCKQKGSELPVLMDTFEGARLNYEAYSDGEHTKFWTDVRFEKVCDFALLIFCTCSLYFICCSFHHLSFICLDLLFFFVFFFLFLLRCCCRVK